MIADLVKSLKDTHVKQIEINDQIGKKREKISFLNTHVTLEHQKKADNNLDNARLKYQYNMGDTNSAIKELYSIGERKGDFTKDERIYYQKLTGGDLTSSLEYLGAYAGIRVLRGVSGLKSKPKQPKVVKVDIVEHIVKKRKSKGGDGASSEHIIEKVNNKTNSTTHKVTDSDGNIIHQHQDFIGESGNKRRFPDNLAGMETINAD